MELDESSHILSAQLSQSLPDTPESSKSDLHQLTEDGEKDKQRSNIPMAVFNCINAIIGSGIIAMPYAIKEAGFGLGIVLVLIVTITTDYSLVLLIKGGELSGTNTYQDVMRAAFGRNGFVCLTIAQFLYPFIAMISYVIIIGDTITKIVLRIGGGHIANTIVARREFTIVAVTMIVTTPLSLYRNIAALAKISLASIGFVVFIIVAMIVRSFTLEIPRSAEAWHFANTGLTRAFGILIYTFVCHHNSFLIYNSLIDPSEKRWSVVTHISVIFSMLYILILGITGYATFTSYCQGDILENYCRTDDLINVARFLFAVTIMLTYPIECFVTREVVENAIFAFKQPASLWRHIVVTIVIIILTVIISMATDCLGVVIELNGIINATPLAFIFPALCVLKLQNDRILSLKNIPCIAMALLGACVVIVGLVFVVKEILDGVRCSHGVEMPYCLAPVNETWSPH